jgi:hypothetical protein
MSLRTLRALVFERNLSAFGVPVTVTRPAPDDTAITTTGIWVTPSTEDVPSGAEFSRRDPRRVLALSRTAVPTCPRGTRIDAPEEQAADTVLEWRVEGLDRQEGEHVRVVVVQMPELV